MLVQLQNVQHFIRIDILLNSCWVHAFHLILSYFSFVLVCEKIHKRPRFNSPHNNSCFATT